MQTLIGVYTDRTRLERTLDGLSDGSGVQADRILYVSDEQLDHDGLGDDSLLPQERLRSELLRLGVPRDEAEQFEAEVRRGRNLLIVTVPDGQTINAQRLLSGQPPIQATASPQTAGAMQRQQQGQTEARVPVIEEEVHIGKRTREAGGVRVEQVVTETPVREQVQLREEHVEVERRPVDRPVTTEDMAALRDQTIEVRAQAEELDVRKEARVVEEVVVRKQTEVHTEQVDEVERRMDVRIEQLPPDRQEHYSRMEADFQAHHRQNHAGHGDWDSYRPAYRAGYAYGAHNDYMNLGFDAAESRLRSSYTRSYSEDAWNRHRDAIRYAYDRAREGRNR